MDILDETGIISNPDPRVTSQLSGISPSMGMFALSSPPIWILGIEGPVTQQDKSPSKPLVYLICKHIVYYNCINNPRKLCPICPSTDMKLEEMEIDDNDMVTDVQESSFTQKKRTWESTAKKFSSKKKKTSNKDDVSSMLKKLIEELLTNILNSGKVLEEANVSDASSNTGVPS
ncbi:hypothetical protein C1646_666917 [Rhizophagus diaphanus]|nr:hypothetical protein C1646_666917 [Rhizophagus diaphanus] [Rhizophagus sp. MUCL 43196]